MNIIIAPDSFKESLSAKEVAYAIKKGFAKVLPQATYHLMPLGDGGEGTIATLADYLHLSQESLVATDALGKDKKVFYAVRQDEAMFEVASLVGLADVPVEKRHPRNLTTVGVGQLLRQLVLSGKNRITIGVGGTATNDAGIGLAVGLGYRFYDKTGKQIVHPELAMKDIASIDAKEVPDLSKVTIRVLSDVSNPLCGPNGASQVFGRQKGLTPSEVLQCDEAFYAFYERFFPTLLTEVGVGAGGGLAAGFLAFADAHLASGIDTILDEMAYDDVVANADLVIVGEGRMDLQSLSGKAPVGVAKRTPQGVPVIAICGSLGDDLPDFPIAGIQAVFPIIANLSSKEQLLAKGRENLERTTQQVAQLLSLSL